jgi:hypothetical protein
LHLQKCGIIMPGVRLSGLYIACSLSSCNNYAEHWTLIKRYNNKQLKMMLIKKQQVL